MISPAGSGVFEIHGKDDGSDLIVRRGSLKVCMAVARNCLSLDTGIDDFYRIVSKRQKRWGWIIDGHMGRFLRSPSLFEDCVKVLMTTNTNWDRTASMVRNLVYCYGRTLGKYRAFPLFQRKLFRYQNPPCAKMSVVDSGQDIY